MGDKYTINCTQNYIVQGIEAEMTGTISGGDTNVLQVSVDDRNIGTETTFETATSEHKLTTEETENIIALASEYVIITTTTEGNDDDDEMAIVKVSILASNDGSCTLERTPAAST